MNRYRVTFADGNVSIEMANTEWEAQYKARGRYPGTAIVSCYLV